MHGSYEALKYGTALDGLADLTGGAAENLKLSQIASSLNVDYLIEKSNNNYEQSKRNGKMLNGGSSTSTGSKVNLGQVYNNNGGSLVAGAAAKLIGHLMGMTSVITAVVEQDPNMVSSLFENRKPLLMITGLRRWINDIFSGFVCHDNLFTCIFVQGKGQQETLQNGILVGINYRVCAVQKVWYIFPQSREYSTYFSLT